MSYPYDSTSPTKYLTKSPLVTDLLVEYELVSGRFSNTERIASMNYFWLYIILVFLVLYPCLCKIAWSAHHSIKVYLFKDISISKSTLDNAVDLQDGAPATRFQTPTLQYDNLINNEALVSSPKSSSSSSTKLPYFDLTNTAGHNLTAYEILQVHYGPTGAPPDYPLSDIQSPQSGGVFSSPNDTFEDPSENVQSNINDFDSTLDLGGPSASFTDSSEPSNQNSDSDKDAGSLKPSNQRNYTKNAANSSEPSYQNDAIEKAAGSSKSSNQNSDDNTAAGNSGPSNQNSNDKKAADSSEPFNQNNATNNSTSNGLNSSIFSDLSEFSFILPSISLSSKFPEFEDNQSSNSDTDASSSRPSRPLPGASHRSHSKNTNSESTSSSNGSSNTSSSSGIQFPKVGPRFANAMPTNIHEGLNQFSSMQLDINEFADRVKEKFERERSKEAQRSALSSGQASSSFPSTSHDSSSKRADSKVKFSNAGGAPVSKVTSKYVTFTSVNFREKLNRSAAQKNATKISADQRRDPSTVQTSDFPDSSHSSPYKTSEDNYSNTSSSGKFALTPKVSPALPHANPVNSHEELSCFSTMKGAINDFADQTKADGKKPMQKQVLSSVQKRKPTIQDDPQPSRSKTQTLDSSDTLPFAGLVPSKFKTQHQNFPSTSQTTEPTSFLFEKQTKATSGSVKSSDSLSSSSTTRPVYTSGTLRSSQLLSYSSSNNSRPRYTPGSLRSSGSSSSSSKSKIPYSSGTLRPALTETLPSNAATVDAFKGIRGPFNVRTLADGIAERARARAQTIVVNRTDDEVTAFVDPSASNTTGNSTIPLDAAQSFSNALKPIESDHSNISPKDQSFTAAMDAASSLDNDNSSAQASDKTSNSNNGFESVDLLVTTTEPVNSVNLDSILLDDQLFVPTATAYANNNRFKQVDFATTIPDFAVNTDAVTTSSLAPRDTTDDSFEQVESATANMAIVNDSTSTSIATHDEDLIIFSPDNHDHAYTNINYNIGPSNITATTTASTAADFQPGTSTNNDIEDDVLKEEAKKEARYESKMAAVFPFTTTKEHYEVVSHGQYIPPPDSGTPVYAAINIATTQSPSSDASNSSSDKTGSPLLFVDTDKPPPPSESDNNEERPISDLLVCQPAGLREYHLPKGLVSLY